MLLFAVTVFSGSDIIKFGISDFLNMIDVVEFNANVTTDVNFADLQTLLLPINSYMYALSTKFSQTVMHCTIQHR